jgi:hypothetical protein
MRGAKAVLDAGVKNGDSPATLRTAALKKIGYDNTPRRTAHLANPAISTPTKRAISTLQAKAGAKREARALLKASRNRVNGDAADMIAAAQEVLGGAVKDLEESRSPPAAAKSLAPEPEPVCCKCRASLAAQAESSGSSTPSEKYADASSDADIRILIPTPASPPRPFLAPPFLADVGSLAAQLARRRESLTPVAPTLATVPSRPSPPTSPPTVAAPVPPAREPKSMQAMLHATPAMLQAAAQGLKHIESSAPSVVPSAVSTVTTTPSATATTATSSVSTSPRPHSPSDASSPPRSDQ